MLALLIAGALTVGIAGSTRANTPASGRADSHQSAYATALDYVVRFYPRWFASEQSQFPPNRLIAPRRISPLYQAVVAINDDTLYASGFMDLAAEPVILTIPKTSVTYSLLALDAYGNILPTSIPSETPGPMRSPARGGRERFLLGCPRSRFQSIS